MLLQFERSNKIRGCVENLLWPATAADAQQQRDKAGDDRSIADCTYLQPVVALPGPTSDLCLTAPDLVVVRDVVFVTLLLAPAPHGTLLVALHPVIEEAELLDQLPLRLEYFVHQLRRQRVPDDPSSMVIPRSARLSRILSAAA